MRLLLSAYASSRILDCYPETILEFSIVHRYFSSGIRKLVSIRQKVIYSLAELVAISAQTEFILAEKLNFNAFFIKLHFQTAYYLLQHLAKLYFLKFIRINVFFCINHAAHVGDYGCYIINLQFTGFYLIRRKLDNSILKPLKMHAQYRKRSPCLMHQFIHQLFPACLLEP